MGDRRYAGNPNDQGPESQANPNDQFANPKRITFGSIFSFGDWSLGFGPYLGYYCMIDFQGDKIFSRRGAKAQRIQKAQPTDFSAPLRLCASA
jgi:hypothetical protein